MESNNNTAAALPRLRAVFYAMLAGQLFFLAVSYYITSQEGFTGQPVIGVSQDLIGVAVYGLIAIAISRFMDRARQKAMPNVRDDAAVGAHYTSTVILRLAILEGAALFAIVFFLLSGNSALLVVYAILLAAFWMAKPSGEEYRDRYGRRAGSL